MKIILLTLVVGIFLILPLVSALDQNFPMICGGDSELLIGCLGDDELIFLAGEAPEEPPWSELGIAPDYVRVPRPEIPEEEIPFFDGLFSIFGLDLQTLKDLKVDVWIITFLSFLIIVFIFASRRRKRKEKKKLLLLLKKEKEEKYKR